MKYPEKKKSREPANKGIVNEIPEKLEKGFEQLISPFEQFVRNEITGSVFLIICTLVALITANSPWSDYYDYLVDARIGIFSGDWAYSKSLQHWVNDGLMALFFFILGLEIKREILAGELQELSRSLPIIGAALGGMILPALIYFTMNMSGAGSNGWGIPMATDTAFAVGVLALLRGYIPSSLAVFLTALAIIDDIGAVLVIAIFYTDTIHLHWLGWVGITFMLLLFCNILGIRRSVPYFFFGFLLWIEMSNSGIHASISGILVALTVPARALKGPSKLSYGVELVLRRLDSRVNATNGKDVLGDDFQHKLIDKIRSLAEQATTPLQQWVHSLAQPVTLFVLPVFALVNAGIDLSPEMLSGIFHSTIMWGVITGLLLGKTIGIAGGCWLVLYLGMGKLPQGMNFSHIIGIGILGAIGFTMSIFIAGLGFAQNMESLKIAKTSIMIASVIAGISGYIWLRFVVSHQGNN